MEQVAKLKRTWILAPVLQIVQKIPENYWPCLYLFTGQIWWLHDVVQKIYPKMYPVSCTNTHHDVTYLGNHRMVKNTKTWISWKQNITFLRNKKIFNLCLRWHTLRIYHFVVEVTFKQIKTDIFVKCWSKIYFLTVIWKEV